MAVRVIIVDDHALVRNAIAGLIDDMEGFVVSAQAENGKALMDILAVTDPPDIILLDINMPVMGGFEAMSILSEKYSAIPVLVLSMNDDEQSIIRMIKAGACGYLSKQVSEDELLLALSHVHETGVYYSDQVVTLLARNLKHNRFESLQLNEREKQFLALACSELTYKEIAEKMFLSHKTIDGYREDLFLKFDVKSRVGLVLYAIRNKLVEV